MLYEITIWRRTATAPLLMATRHELGHLSTIKDLAKTALQAFPGAGPAYFVRVSEAHNGREVFNWRFDQTR